MVGARSGAAPAPPPKPVATPRQPKMPDPRSVNRKMKSVVLHTGNTVYTQEDARKLKEKLHAEGIPADVTVGKQNMRTGVVTVNSPLQDTGAGVPSYADACISVRLSDLELFVTRIDQQTSRAFNNTEKKVNAIDKNILDQKVQMKELVVENMTLKAMNQKLNDRLSKMEQEMLDFQQSMMTKLMSFEGDILSMGTSSRDLARETTRLRQMMDDDTPKEGDDEAFQTPQTSPFCKRRLQDRFPLCPTLGPQHAGEDINKDPLSLTFCTLMA